MGCGPSNPEMSSQKAPGEVSGKSYSTGGGDAAVSMKSVSSEGVTAKEDQIKIAFKAKRANVFTSTVNLDKGSYEAKVIPKTPEQTGQISSALKKNFVFDGIDEKSEKTIIDAMELQNVPKGKTLITQGDDGDYFYVIANGSFEIIVNGNQVALFEAGKSFGELALVYNTPRQATVTAHEDSVVFALDRDTFRYTLAHSLDDKQAAILEALRKFPLLEGLTTEQINKIADTVEVINYNPKDVIIRKGTQGSIFYMIKAGEVRVSDVGAKFKDHSLGPGGYFGERALMTNEPRAATITAVKPTTLLALDKEEFQKLLGPLQELLDYNLSMRVLSSIKMFEKLTTSEKVRLCRSFHEASFEANKVIVKQGEHGSKFFVLVHGRVDVICNDTKVAELGAGEYFGEMALLDNEPRKATVMTKEKSKCFYVDRETFTKTLGPLQDVMARQAKVRANELGIPQEPENQMLELQFSELKTLAVLGSGTFGRVTLVQDKHTEKVYALKTMLKAEIVAHKQQANVMNEKNLMQACNHPFILRLHQTFKDARKLHMLLEFVQGGELFTVIHKPNSDGVSNEASQFYAAGVILAIAYMHQKNIAYRDMKPENCLVDKDGYPKIVDFGFAKIISSKSFTLCGTPEYLAPELVLGRGHNKAVDYWAFGVLVYEMQVSDFIIPRCNKLACSY
jgi:cGMP-dependent protein kinase